MHYRYLAATYFEAVSMKEKFVFLLLIYLVSFPALAQRMCLSNRTLNGYASLDRSLDEDTTLTIPVVVHLIAFDSTQFISDDDVIWQINSTTLDFTRRNDDQNQTPDMFKDLAADCRIEFCLATIDPSGHSTQGITRTVTDISEIGFTDSYYQSILGGHDPWDPSSYLNIWVCEISEAGEVAGYSSLPDGSELWDGIVIDYRYFGRGLHSLPPFNYGRTLTHEMGHWMGLNHIWGNQPGCDTDDGIADTPRQFDHYSGCPVFPQLSCGSEDMFMNFMDLTDDQCVNLFTADQKAYMRGLLLLSRSSLIHSTKCDDQVTEVNNNGIKYKISPNPVTNFLEIRYIPYSRQETSVYTIYGELVAFFTQNEKLDVSALKPGTYLLQIHAGSSRFIGKFVKI